MRLLKGILGISFAATVRIKAARHGQGDAGGKERQVDLPVDGGPGVLVVAWAHHVRGTRSSRQVARHPPGCHGRDGSAGLAQPLASTVEAETAVALCRTCGPRHLE